jgi:hypothetical protein
VVEYVKVIMLISLGILILKITWQFSVQDIRELVGIIDVVDDRRPALLAEDQFQVNGVGEPWGYCL